MLFEIADGKVNRIGRDRVSWEGGLRPASVPDRFRLSKPFVRQIILRIGGWKLQKGVNSCPALHWTGSIDWYFPTNFSSETASSASAIPEIDGKCCTARSEKPLRKLPKPVKINRTTSEIVTISLLKILLGRTKSSDSQKNVF